MKWGLGIKVIAILGALLLCPTLASAGGGTPTASVPANQPVQANGVGIAGGAIAGAEVVVAVQAIFGVNKVWPYLTIPVLGAAGGGVGGYFLEKKAPPQASVGLLIGGIALFIPTLLAASAATAYDPSEEGTIEREETGPGFSFETAPSTESENESATTEIETRPEGAPENTVAPPPEGGPPAPDSPAEPSDESGSDSTDSSRRPRTEVGTDDELARQRRRAEHEQHLADIRRATAGALLFVDRKGKAAFSVPNFSIRPTFLSNQPSLYPKKEAVNDMKQGVEVMITLLRVDLP